LRRAREASQRRASPRSRAPAFAQTGEVLLEVRQFALEGENPLSEQEAQSILAPHLGRHTSLATIEAAANALETAMRGTGSFVPSRDRAGAASGRRRGQAADPAIPRGRGHGQRKSVLHERKRLRAVPALQPGTAPDLRELSRQLSLANEHPAKRLTINIKESRTPNALDADVKVADVPSQQTFIALTGGTSDVDNTINRNTGYTRLTLGHQQSNLFDRDHALTLTYTTSPDHIDDVMQVGAFYWLPLYGYNTALRAFWSRSDVDSGSVGVGGQSFDVSGRGEFYGLERDLRAAEVRLDVA
jgi:hemolysin activation/secretion protein